LVTKRNGKMRERPRKGEKLLEVHQIEAEIEFNAEKVAEAKSKLGRFILATNDLNLDPNTIARLAGCCPSSRFAREIQAERKAIEIGDDLVETGHIAVAPQGADHEFGVSIQLFD
jgi:hypothetical protein